MNCCREAFPEPSQLSPGLFHRNIVCQREQQGLSGSELDSHLKLPPSQALLLAHTAPRLRNQQLLHRLEEAQRFANAAVGSTYTSSTGLVCQRFMRCPNVTVQNLRLQHHQALPRGTAPPLAPFLPHLTCQHRFEPHLLSFHTTHSPSPFTLISKTPWSSVR